MATNYDGNRAMNGNNLYTFWVTIKSLILGWLSAKQDTITGGATTITSDNLDKNRALISNGNGKVAVSGVTSTELGYLDGVTGNVQGQLDAKVDTSKVKTTEDSSSSQAENVYSTGYINGKLVQASSSLGLVKAGEITDVTGYIPVKILNASGSASQGNGYLYVAETDISGKMDKDVTVGSTSYSTADMKFVNGTNTTVAWDDTNKAVKVNSTDTKMANKSYTAGTDAKVVVGTKITGNNTLADVQKTLTAGTNISITGASDKITIACTYSYTLPIATDSVLGGVKKGANVNISSAGVISIPFANAQENGVIGVRIGDLGGVDEDDGYVDCFGLDDQDHYNLKMRIASTTEGGAMSKAMVSKLNGIEAGANNYVLPTADPSTVGGMKLYTTGTTASDGALAAGYVTSQLSAKAPLASPDFTGTPTISGNAIATQSYVDTAITGAETFKGTLASEADLKAYGNFKAGWYWRVALPSGTSTATIAGQTVESGDMVYCTVTHNHTAGDDITNANFNVVNTNIVFLTDTEIAEIVNAAS